LLNEDAAVTLAGEHGKPLYHLLHNNTPAFRLLSAPPNNFIIYNSEALQRELSGIALPSIVCRPVIDVNYWHNDIDHFNNEYITLVNCAVEKGGIVLQQLADSMPGERFMGVKGGYGTQIIQRNAAKNIQFMPQQLDMKVIYNQTKILIMPSEYESWGMVASEAMASGIPVICSDTPGLRENCGDAAVYVPGQYVAGYRTAIEYLSTPSYYAECVYDGLKRNHGNDLDKLLKFIEGSEKEERQPTKEKKEMPTVKEKHIIEKPGSVKRSHHKKVV